MATLFRPESVYPVKMAHYGLMFYVPKVVIQEIAKEKKIYLLNFDMPYFMRTALCKAATELRNEEAKALAEAAGTKFEKLPKVKLQRVGLNSLSVNLSPKEIGEIRKSSSVHERHVVDWIIKSSVLTKALSEISPEESMLYWGVGPASETALNPLSDAFNMNCWLHTHISYLEYLYATEGEAAYFKAMGSPAGMLSVQRKGGSTNIQALTLNSVPLIDRATDFNVFDRLVEHMFVNGMRLNKLQTQALVVLTLILNYSSSMGNIRRALRGAVSAPTSLDEDNGQLVIGKTENTALFWVPLNYYRRSPIAEESQKQHARFAKVYFDGERIVWENSISEGIFFRNGHLDPNAIVCSLLGADSKAAKVVHRHKLIAAVRCEIVDERGNLAEEDSCVVLHIQSNGPAHTHEQLTYTLMGGLGIYVQDGGDAVTLSTYLSEPEAEDASQLTDEQLYQEFVAELPDLDSLELKPF